jgi:outer membrane protein OmpA-like peptidoglycan-associated protein
MLKRQKPVYFLLMLAFTIPGLVNAQNLVPNYSFENLRGCPTSLGQLRLTGSWLSFGTSDPSPDIYGACAERGQMGVPENLFGFQPAKTGANYAGFIAYLTSKSGKSWKLKSNHREFMVTHLMQPLVKDVEYHVEMSVSLAENCEFAIANIGILLTKDISTFDPMAIELGFYKPQIRNNPEKVLDQKQDWVRISGTYKAKGGEKVLSIGNFDADKITNFAKNKDGKNVFFDNMPEPKKVRPILAYYFIDDVILRPLRPTPIDLQQPTSVTSIPSKNSQSDTFKTAYFGLIKKGEKIVLQNIYFDFNETVLLQASYKELNALFDFLVSNPVVKIEIVGHTDNLGSADYNMALSLERAFAVASYLTTRGIAANRITALGKGSTVPLVANDSELGRAKNRRVEFEIIDTNKQ